MPQDRDLSIFPIRVSENENKPDYPEQTGREIFEELSLTGLNRAPVTTLSSFIETGYEVVGEPRIQIEVEEMISHLLVDGAFAILSKEIVSEKELRELWKDYKILTDLKRVSESEIIESLKDQNGVPNKISRVYQLQGETWIVRDVKYLGHEKKEIVVNEVKYPKDAIIPVVNNIEPRGILYPNQHTYHRLEEIEMGLRHQTGPASLSLIVSGYVGDITKAHNTFSGGNKVVFVPGNATVTRVAANNTADQLMRNGALLMRLYFRNTHVIDDSEATVLSGVSRRLLMTPMLAFIESMRGILKDFYESLGAILTFGGIQILAPEEREAELRGLTSARELGILNEAQFKARAEALYL